MIAPSGASAIPDARGANPYAQDPMLARLLGLYLKPDALAHLTHPLRAAVKIALLAKIGHFAENALFYAASTSQKTSPPHTQN